jgi:hypothetical protein
LPDKEKGFDWVGTQGSPPGHLGQPYQGICCLASGIPFVGVPDPGKGVCADPVNGGAILGKGGPDPQSGNKGRQLSPDKGREKT